MHGFLLLKTFYFLILSLCLCTCVGLPMDCRGLGFPGAGVTGGCEPSDMGAGSQTWLLYKSRSVLNLHSPLFLEEKSSKKKKK